MSKMSSWGEMLREEFSKTGDDFNKMTTTLNDTELFKRFYSGYGGANGRPFTAWGEKYVYFPVVYDGSEWVGHAPRNPCDEATRHQGGE